MKYNKSEIMKRAHYFRATMKTTTITNRVLPITMANALRMAWAEAKRKANETPADRLFYLNMKDRWTDEDFELARELKRQIVA